MRANSAFNRAFVLFQQKIANDYARKQRFQQKIANDSMRTNIAFNKK